MSDNRLYDPLLTDKTVEIKTLTRFGTIIESDSLINESKGIKDDLGKVIGYMKSLNPVMIDTPFQGSSLVMTQDENQYVFGSREGRLGVVDRTKKQVTLDVDLNQGSIWTMTLIENDKYVLSAGASGDIKKILFSDLTVVDTFIGHQDEINFIQVSSDETFMYTASDDRTVREWRLDLPDNQERSTILFTHEGTVYCIDLSFDGKYLASGSADNTVKVFFLQDRTELVTLTDAVNSVWCVKISNQNNFVVAGDQSGEINVWRFGTWELTKKLLGHTARVRFMDMSKDESFLVTAGLDENIKVWDMISNRKEITLRGHKGWVKFSIISKDQSRIFSVSDDKKVCEWKIPKFDDQIKYSHPSDSFKNIFSSKGFIYAQTDNNIVEYTPLFAKVKDFGLQDYTILSYEISNDGEFCMCLLNL